MVQGPRFALTMLLVAAASTAPAATGVPQAGDAYLRSTIGLPAGDIKRVHAGEPISTSLDGHEGREVVTFGAVRIDRTPEDVLAYLGRIDALRQGAAVQQLGVLSSPPRLNDLATFTLHPDSVESLKGCRIGDCGVQLPGWAMTRFAAATDSVHAIARSVVLETAIAYLRGGHTALPAYEDRRPPVQPSDEYTRLLGSAQYLPAPLTVVRESLNQFPQRPAPGVRDLLFWSVMDLGMKPMFRLSHRAIATGPALDHPTRQLTGVIATIQVMATHYFSSTLEWHFVMSDPSDPSRAYVYFLSRSFAPGMTGIRGRIARFTIRGRAQKGVETYLRATKHRLETESGAGR